MKTDCLGHQQIRDFSLGRVGRDAEREIVEHLEACDVCSDAAAEQDRERDSFVEILCGPGRESEAAGDAHYRQAQARVKQLPLESPPDREAPPDDAPPLTQLRDYRLLRKLGEGGMGTVYLARHTRLDRIVAIKVLPPDRMRSAQAVARFQQEMRAAGSFDHPSIVRATDAGDVSGTHFLVMEYVEGTDLSTLSRRLGPLAMAPACELVRQAAIGLKHVHRVGMVHRDIKPSNLMLTPEGTVKILDLGLALLQDQQQGVHELTTLGQFLGTLDYMAPEQADDSHEVDARADIYSLGATLYKLLSSQPPFSGRKFNSPLKKFKGLALLPVPPIREHRPEIPQPLACLIERMLAKSPADRHTSLDEVIETLAPFAVGADLAALAQEAARQTSQENEAPLPGEKGPLAHGVSAVHQHEPGHGAMEAAAQLALHGKVPRIVRGVWLFAAAAVLLLAGFAVYVLTDNGQLIVESSDPHARVLVKQGDQVVQDWELEQGKNKTTLRSGRYEVELLAPSDGLKVTDGVFTLTRRGQHVATIQRVDGAKAVIPAPETAKNEARYNGRPYSEWLSLLKTERNPEGVAEAVEALGTLGTDDPSRRVEAVSAILEAAPQYDFHIFSLNKKDEKAKGACIAALKRLDSPNTFERIVDELVQGSSQSRMLVFAFLLDELREKGSAARYLQIADDRLWTGLLRASYDPNPPIRGEAFFVMSSIYREVQEVRTPVESVGYNERLHEALQDESLYVVAVAAESLAYHDPGSADTVAALIRVLDKGKHDDKQIAVRALGILGPGAKAAVPKLASMLRESAAKRLSSTPEGLICSMVAYTLGEAGPAAKEAVPTLIEFLQTARQNNYDGVRSLHIAVRVVETLGEIGPSAKAAIPLLTELTNEREPDDIIRAANEALIKISADEEPP